MVNKARDIAKKNNLEQKISQMKFDLFKPNTKLIKKFQQFQTWILDPPRAGALELVRTLNKTNSPQKIIYISCNPDTLKRDLYLFSENDYKVTFLEGVDMFPRTLHSEMIAVIELDDEIELLERMVKENKKNNTKSYKENKMKYIPKADIEMMREDRYEASGNKKQKKFKY